MASVVLQNLSKTYEGSRKETIPAVCRINLSIADKEFLVLVGPSGCGKTTTLRMIAGLESISGGSIYIDGELVNDMPPKDRDIGMVFQNYALYPHMTVFENMAFGLKLRQFARPEIHKRVREAAELLDLHEVLERKPSALSGGQRQRVALGRAIVRKPKVFLFDEPLSNLDARMRVQMRAELLRLHHRLGATMIYVTHDQVEAMTMGDRIAVMKDGLLEQVDTPIQLYRKPANLFIGGFIGSPPMNFLKGMVSSKGEETWFEESFDGSDPDLEAVRTRLAPSAKKGLSEYMGKAIVLGLRPEDLTLVRESKPDRTISTARVELIETLGSEACVHLTTGEHRFIARVPTRLPVKLNQTWMIELNTDQARFFDPGTAKVVGD